MARGRHASAWASPFDETVAAHTGEAATALHFGSWTRLVAFAIVVGLTASVPASFGASATEHFGVLLHPMFPHVHAVDYPDRAGPEAHGAGSTLFLEFDQQPGLRGQPVDSGFRPGASGMLVPLALAALAAAAGRLHQPPQAVPSQTWRAPPAPPPRRRLAAQALG